MIENEIDGLLRRHLYVCFLANSSERERKKNEKKKKSDERKH